MLDDLNVANQNNSTDLRTTIFVGNLSVFCTELDLEQVFAPFGTILEIRMAKSEDRSKHLSYGFVKFSSVASAQLAMLELDGKILHGRKLK
jgi:RNA recognition motif-containing protein